MKPIEVRQERTFVLELTETEVALIEALACIGEAGGYPRHRELGTPTEGPCVQGGVLYNGKDKGGALIHTPFRALVAQYDIKRIPGLLPDDKP